MVEKNPVDTEPGRIRQSFETFDEHVISLYQDLLIY
jgi:hypothetical protein